MRCNLNPVPSAVNPIASSSSARTVMLPCCTCEVVRTHRNRRGLRFKPLQRITSSGHLEHHAEGYQGQMANLNDGLGADVIDDQTIDLHLHPPFQSDNSQSPLCDLSNLRLATQDQRAKCWLEDNQTPALPTRKIAIVEVYDGWACPETVNFAKEVIARNPEASLSDVHLALLHGYKDAQLPVPYLWLVQLYRKRIRGLHRDANNQQFIRLDKKWFLAYSLQEMADLVGWVALHQAVQVEGNYIGYFIRWENEDLAKNYYHYRKLRQQEVQEND